MLSNEAPISVAGGLRRRSRRAPIRAASGRAARRRRCPSRSLMARSGCGIRPTTLRALIADAGDVVDRAIGVVDIANDDPIITLQLSQGLGVTRVVALEVVDRDAKDLTDLGRVRSAPSRRSRPVARPRHTGTSVPGSSATRPGSRPASVSTWKPLQMPITGPPSAANSATAPMTGEKRAMAPGRR